MLTTAIQATSTITDLRRVSNSGVLFERRSRLPSSFFVGNAEPSLNEIMNDPIMRGMMACDGVAADSLLGLIDEVRTRLRVRTY